MKIEKRTETKTTETYFIGELKADLYKSMEKVDIYKGYNGDYFLTTKDGDILLTSSGLICYSKEVS